MIDFYHLSSLSILQTIVKHNAGMTNLITKPKLKVILNDFEKKLTLVYITGDREVT